MEYYERLDLNCFNVLFYFSNRCWAAYFKRTIKLCYLISVISTEANKKYKTDIPQNRHTPHRMQSFVFLCRSLPFFVAIQFSTLLKVWWKFAVAILYSMPDYPYLWTLNQMDECFVYAFTHRKKRHKDATHTI